MKKTLLAVAVIGCSVSVAYAAPKAEPMTAEVSKINGVYIGINAGGSVNIDREPALNISNSQGVDSMNLAFKGRAGFTYLAGASMGYNFAPVLHVPVRAEFAYTYRGESTVTTATQDIYQYNMKVAEANTKIKSSIATYMVNAYYDLNFALPSTRNIAPYVVVGMGLAQTNIQPTLNSKSVGNDEFRGSELPSVKANNFAWNVGVGVAYDVADNWTVDFDVKYLNTGKSKSSLSSDVDEKLTVSSYLDSVDATVGVRYTF